MIEFIDEQNTSNTPACLCILYYNILWNEMRYIIMIQSIFYLDELTLLLSIIEGLFVWVSLFITSFAKYFDMAWGSQGHRIMNNDFPQLRR